MNKYQWIIDEFSKLKGVEKVFTQESDDGRFYLIATNDRIGKDGRLFQLPLKEQVVVGLSGGEQIFDYDITDMDESGLLVQAAIKKAERVFNN